MKVLIIEDEVELAKSIVSYLSGQNYLCEQAKDYHQALEKVSLHSYDCILLDLMLPGGSGMRILDELKAQNKEDGVIIISAKNSLEDKIHGLELGADDYLSETFSFIGTFGKNIFCDQEEKLWQLQCYPARRLKS